MEHKHRRIEDDYLLIEAYSGHSAMDANGFTFFQGGKQNLHYFATQSADGKVLFRSEGYPNEEVREIGVKSVINNRDFYKNYEITEHEGQFQTILLAQNNQEIARSGFYDSREALGNDFPKVKTFSSPPEPVPVPVPMLPWWLLPLALLGLLGTFYR